MFKPLTRVFEKSNSALARRPILAFFGLIVLLFGVIALGHFLRTPKAAENPLSQEKKETAIFNPSQDTPFLAVPAEVKKENVIDIVALTPGIVSAIHTQAGRLVAAGQVLIEITNDYQSGSASVQKQIALNNATLTQKLAATDKRIFALKEKQARHDETLTKTEEKIALKQLEEDRAQNKIDLQNSVLNLRLTNVSDAVLKPKTFVSGTVANIAVRKGDLVSAGDRLITLHTKSGAATIEALISRKTAALFDPTKTARLTIDSETIELLPVYFSQVETRNGLFSVLFTLSETTKSKIVNGEFLQIELPLRATDSTALLAPIDAIFQDTEQATVLVEEDGIATVKTVTLGNIYGSFAEITSGLTPDAHIILNRAVIAGDAVIIH
jgi:RND family efflux transporter MFP subunit